MTATGNADNTVTFSFDSPRTNVDLNSLQTAIDASASEADPVGTPAAAAPTPAAQATAPTPTPAQEPATTTQTASPEDLKTYEIVVDGQTLTVTEADLKAGHMRQRDYTQKTQRLAEQERQVTARVQAFEAQVNAQAAELDAIDRFLQDEQAIQAYTAKAFRRLPAAPLAAAAAGASAATPDAIAYADQLRQATETQLAQVRAESQARVDALEQRQAALARQTQTAAISREVDAHIETILTKHPDLRKFESITDELIGDAGRYAPRSIEEAKTRLTEAAERRIATIQSIATEQKKVAAVKAAQLTKTSPEPPGGSTPRQAAAKTLSMGDVDRKTRLAEAQEYLQGLLSNQG